MIGAMLRGDALSNRERPPADPAPRGALRMGRRHGRSRGVAGPDNCSQPSGWQTPRAPSFPPHPHRLVRAARLHAAPALFLRRVAWPLEGRPSPGSPARLLCTPDRGRCSSTGAAGGRRGGEEREGVVA